MKLGLTTFQTICSLSLGLLFIVFGFNNCGNNFDANNIDSLTKSGVVKLKFSTATGKSQINEVEYKNVDGLIVIEDDMILGDETKITEGETVSINAIQSQSAVQQLNTNGVSGKTFQSVSGGVVFRLWEDGFVPFSIAESFTEDQKIIIERSIDSFNKLMSDNNIQVSFIEKEPEDTAYVNFANTSLNICSANVGYNGGRTLILMGSKCFNESTIHHEMMHILGFLHEHNRNDRDNFIEFLAENTKPEKLKQYKKWPGLINNTKYDVNSIMHYGSFDNSVNGEPVLKLLNGSTFESSKTLSDLDLAGLQMAYGTGGQTINYNPLKIADDQLIKTIVQEGRTDGPGTGGFTTGNAKSKENQPGNVDYTPSDDSAEKERQKNLREMREKSAQRKKELEDKKKTPAQKEAEAKKTKVDALKAQKAAKDKALELEKARDERIKALQEAQDYEKVVVQTKKKNHEKAVAEQKAAQAKVLAAEKKVKEAESIDSVLVDIPGGKDKTTHREKAAKVAQAKADLAREQRNAKNSAEATAKTKRELDFANNHRAQREKKYQASIDKHEKLQKEHTQAQRAASDAQKKAQEAENNRPGQVKITSTTPIKKPIVVTGGCGSYGVKCPTPPSTQPVGEGPKKDNLDIKVPGSFVKSDDNQSTTVQKANPVNSKTCNGVRLVKAFRNPDNRVTVKISGLNSNEHYDYDIHQVTRRKRYFKYRYTSTKISSLLPPISTGTFPLRAGIDWHGIEVVTKCKNGMKKTSNRIMLSAKTQDIPIGLELSTNIARNSCNKLKPNMAVNFNGENTTIKSISDSNWVQFTSQAGGKWGVGCTRFKLLNSCKPVTLNPLRVDASGYGIVNWKNIDKVNHSRYEIYQSSTLYRSGLLRKVKYNDALVGKATTNTNYFKAKITGTSVVIKTYCKNGFASNSNRVSVPKTTTIIDELPVVTKPSLFGMKTHYLSTDKKKNNCSHLKAGMNVVYDGARTKIKSISSGDHPWVQFTSKAKSAWGVGCVKGISQVIQERIPSSSYYDTNVTPRTCSTWFDGCNTCKTMNGKPVACTKKMCKLTAPAKGKCLDKKPPVVVKPPIFGMKTHYLSTDKKKNNCSHLKAGMNVVYDGARTKIKSISSGDHPWVQFTSKAKSAWGVGCVKGISQVIQERIPSSSYYDTNVTPRTCSTWFDGCNTCKTINGKPVACTKKMCHLTAPAKGKCLDKKPPVVVKPPIFGMKTHYLSTDKKKNNCSHLKAGMNVVYDGARTKIKSISSGKYPWVQFTSKAKSAWGVGCENSGEQSNKAELVKKLKMQSEQLKKLTEAKLAKEKAEKEKKARELASIFKSAYKLDKNKNKNSCSKLKAGMPVIFDGVATKIKSISSGKYPWVQFTSKAKSAWGVGCVNSGEQSNKADLAKKAKDAEQAAKKLLEAKLAKEKAEKEKKARELASKFKSAYKLDKNKNKNSCSKLKTGMPVIFDGVATKIKSISSGKYPWVQFTSKAKSAWGVGCVGSSSSNSNSKSSKSKSSSSNKINLGDNRSKNKCNQLKANMAVKYNGKDTVIREISKGSYPWVSFKSQVNGKWGAPCSN